MSDINRHDDDVKPVLDTAHIDQSAMVHDIDNALEKNQPVQMKSSLDHLSVWQAALAYKRVTLLCFVAAFSASLDGYRKLLALGALRR